MPIKAKQILFDSGRPQTIDDKAVTPLESAETPEERERRHEEALAKAERDITAQMESEHFKASAKTPDEKAAEAFSKNQEEIKQHKGSLFKGKPDPSFNQKKTKGPKNAN